MLIDYLLWARPWEAIEHTVVDRSSCCNGTYCHNGKRDILQTYYSERVTVSEGIERNLEGLSHPGK